MKLFVKNRVKENGKVLLAGDVYNGKNTDQLLKAGALSRDKPRLDEIEKAVETEKLFAHDGSTLVKE